MQLFILTDVSAITPFGNLLHVFFTYVHTKKAAQEEQSNLRGLQHQPILILQDLSESRSHPLPSQPNPLTQCDERRWGVLLCFMHSRWDSSLFPPPIPLFQNMCSAQSLYVMNFTLIWLKRSWVWSKTTGTTCEGKMLLFRKKNICRFHFTFEAQLTYGV